MAIQGQLSAAPTASRAARRVAVVDTETAFLRVLERRLVAAGWEPRQVSAEPVLAELQRSRAICAVVDPHGLGGDPWELLDQVCASGASVLVCTAPSTVAERVRGLRMGVDDWISKPCHPEEVIARLEAVVRRRVRGDASPTLLRAGELELRGDMYDAFVGGQAVGLTRREFELLRAFVESGGRVVPREELYEQVWGYTMAHGDRSVDVFVRRLRTKLADASPGWSYLHTHFGVGYRFEAAPTSS